MSTSLRLSIDEYERMIANGAFVGIERRLEFIRGELREMSPAGPYHDDYIDFLTRWSTTTMSASEASIRIQSAILLGDSMPEPDVMWLKPGRYGGRRPQADDALLLIEVADSSLKFDLGAKACLYAEHGIGEYWVVDVPSQTIHRHTDPASSGFQTVTTHHRPESITPRVKPKAVLSLNELFSSE